MRFKNIQCKFCQKSNGIFTLPTIRDSGTLEVQETNIGAFTCNICGKTTIIKPIEL